MKIHPTLINSFRVCRKAKCRTVNHPFANFCNHCGKALGVHQLTRLEALPEPIELGKGEKNNYFIMGGLTPLEFVEGLEKLLRREPLSKKQEAARRLLRSYLNEFE